MYKYILDTVGDFNGLAIVPLVIFFVFFTVMTIRVMRSDKKHIEHMGNLPLEND